MLLAGETLVRPLIVPSVKYLLVIFKRVTPFMVSKATKDDERRKKSRGRKRIGRRWVHGQRFAGDPINREERSLHPRARIFIRIFTLWPDRSLPTKLHFRTMPPTYKGM